MPRPVPIHNLRGNESCWSPPAIFVFDTEAVPIPGSDPEILALKCWVSRTVRRRGGKEDAVHHWENQGTTAAELLDALEASTTNQSTLWVYAHNLGFDLTTTNAIPLLGDRGWTVTDFSVSGPSPWFRLTRRSKHLCLTDSWSWLPSALKDIGAAMGEKKTRLPRPDESLEVWLQRCRQDVRITTAALCQLMAWWDREKLGRWSITGAATGWNAYRHFKHPVKVTIDPDPAARAFERQAVRGGRRDCWRIGTFHAGPYANIDIASAHATIAAELLLPRQRIRSFPELPLDTPWLRRRGWGLLAEVTVSTDAPRYPLKWRGLTWWPTGTFRTVLAHPEILMAERRGELRAIGQGHLYWLGPHMAPWAKWVLAVAAGELADTPPAARLAAKAWGRSVIGKWAGRTHESIRLGTAPVAGWHLERGYNHTLQARGAMVDLNGARWWVTAHQEPDNSFPAVLAWVESELRVRMAAMVDHLGQDVVVVADTDGLWVDLPRWLGKALRGRQAPRSARGWTSAARLLCEGLEATCAPLVPRVKSLSDDLSVIGPQHLEGRGWRKLAGIHRDAKQVEVNTYEAKLFPSLAWQMERGDPRGFTCPVVTNTVTGPYAGKWQLANGKLWPVQAHIDDNGQSQIVPYWDMTKRPRPDLPALAQHLILDRHFGALPAHLRTA